MSFTAFLTEDFRLSQPRPPSLSSAGSGPSPAAAYFWMRSSRSTGTSSFASPA